MFTPRSLIFSRDGQNFMIDDNNFSFLQEALTNICCLKTGPMD
jgi:hypothetical protein